MLSSPMNREERRKAPRHTAHRYDLSKVLKPIPREDWPTNAYKTGGMPRAVFMSNQFLVQIFDEEGGFTRISVNRIEMGRDGRWLADITWDQLQQVKADVGYALQDAVEVYPAERDVVNVANIRHLWVVPAGYLPFAWRKK